MCTNGLYTFLQGFHEDIRRAYVPAAPGKASISMVAAMIITAACCNKIILLGQSMQLFLYFF